MKLFGKTFGRRFALYFGTAVMAVGGLPALAASAPAPSSTAPAAQYAQTAADSDAGKLCTLWDTNHDNALSPSEFRVGWDALAEQTALRRLHERFIAMDTDKNGCLNAAEYSHLALIQKPAKVAPPMSQFDAERNGCLDFKEYVNFVDYMIAHEKK